MTISSRRFPSTSAGLLVAGIAAVFLAAAAPPAKAPVPAPAAPALSVPDAAPPASPAQPAMQQANAAPAAAPAKPPLPKELSITIDQTRTLELDNAVSTVSVGNPAIADVNLQNGNRLFLIGKTFGRTNVVALNANGDTVLDMMVFVTSSGGGSVTVYKGNRQITYNCAPNCDRALMPGDSKDDFDMISGQNSTKTGFGTGGRE